MIETERHLLERNQIAATIGQDIVIDQLKKFRERFFSQMKSCVVSANDPYGINMQRALGRIEAIDFLITEGENARKPQNNNKKDK